MSDAIPSIGARTKSKGSSGGSGRGTAKDYPQLAEEWAELLFDTIEGTDGDASLPTFGGTDYVAELPEEVVEQYELEGDSLTNAVESFMPWDISERFDYENLTGLGGDLTFSMDELDAMHESDVISEDELESLREGGDDKVTWSPDTVESTPHNDIRVCFVGNHAEEIVDRFGEDATVRVMTAPRDVVDEPNERWLFTRFYVSKSETAARSRRRAERDAGTISESEYQDWCEANGFQP